MSGYENASARAIASAALRLRSARHEFRRAEVRLTDARGTADESWTMLRVTEAGAELSTREQWLHWIEYGTTIRPAADGEWGLAPKTKDSVGVLTPGRRAARIEGPLGRTALAMSVPRARASTRTMTP
jgi:hypothetical protein